LKRGVDYSESEWALKQFGSVCSISQFRNPMNEIHTNSPEVRRIVETAFPNYRGRQISIEAFTHPLDLTSYWSGGYRDYWAFVNITTGKVGQVAENGSGFSGNTPRCERLQNGVALVRWTYGPRQWVKVYLDPSNLTKLLPAAPELTQDELIVLVFTRCRKSSYNGQNRWQMAREDTGISSAEWETAKAGLIAKRLLNKAGAITDEGRNATSGVHDHSESLVKPGWDKWRRRFIVSPEPQISTVAPLATEAAPLSLMF
jgi:hypothetical protein